MSEGLGMRLICTCIHTCTMIDKKQPITFFECDISHIILVVGWYDFTSHLLYMVTSNMFTSNMSIP